MYKAFYGLSCEPFQINPDPRFYYASKQHRRAKAYLEYGVMRSEGFIVITGEVGAGKTTVVRGLLDSLDADKVVAANLVTTMLDAEDTLRMVGAAFGVRSKDISKSDLLITLEAFLVSQTSQGKRCLLIVDEAQNLTRQAVEELRMLSNFQFGQQALLQTFLVGQPEFRTILQSPDMQQLRQRVTATCHIGPLDQTDTKNYIEHRLKCAGASAERPSFDAPAFEAIFKATSGIPRRINMVCDRLLLSGYLNGRDSFGVEQVNEIVSEIADESGLSAGPRPVEDAEPDWSDSYLDDASADKNADNKGNKLRFSPGLSHALTGHIATLSAEQYDIRLRRLEGSALRLERLNLEILVMLQKLIKVAMAVPHDKDKED
ncbi:MAG: AAA family ATPase [Rhodoferax sp.]|nr:AAA family ATPase [Rhodoferax sp.]OIP20182.1 MAG: ATPase [Comamonadaceae bacterium CG2_30_60_41]PIW09469.1 MAG: ATPase [Comamonadaceae bacterium CG17_big_fil_post_rev_8_21_14_2_50_60_13]PIY26297.1 MAG: ATPase [Comamonadaceae bacterium CG_4_10_14_3_um_filter_60_75]PJC14080.1 MAG: ATPase [Comamonadaceae bacterium CG_4_9_14_0_8_um_filter_60_18]